MFAASKNTAVVSLQDQGRRAGRRAFLGVLAGVALESSPAPAQGETPAEPALTALDLDVPGFGAGFHQVRVLVPGPSRTAARSRAVVLLHGLGETHRAGSAMIAWSDLYGARAADSQLLAPPLSPLKPRFWDAARLEPFNRELSARPYIGAMLVCPRTPNPSLAKDRTALLDAYATWLCDGVLPAVERALPGSTAQVGLDGCSLGGYVAVEVLLRRASRFAAAGCVQGALGEHRLGRYAEALTAIARARPEFRFRIASSLRDSYLELGRTLSRQLTDRGVGHELDVVPGPHNQPWLCEIGTPRLLRWYDLTLGKIAAAKAP